MLSMSAWDSGRPRYVRSLLGGHRFFKLVAVRLYECAVDHRANALGSMPRRFLKYSGEYARSTDSGRILPSEPIPFGINDPAQQYAAVESGDPPELEEKGLKPHLTNTQPGVSRVSFAHDQAEPLKALVCREVYRDSP